MTASLAWVHSTSSRERGDPLEGLAGVASMELSPILQSSGQHWFWDPVLTYAVTAVYAERFIDAEQMFGKILDSACQCEPFVLVQGLGYWIIGLCRLGRLREAAAHVDRLAEVTELFLPGGPPLASVYQALVLTEQGQLEQAAHCCDQVTARTRRTARLYHNDGLLLHVRGVLALRQGDAETACALFGQLHQLAERGGELNPSRLPWVADALAAYLNCGRDTDARQLLNWIQPWADVFPTRWPKIMVASGRAALAEREGNQPLAEACFAHALALHDEMDIAMPLARAGTLTEYGAFLNRTGEPTRARPLLAEALRVAETCGAGWHANQARMQWRRAGGRTRTHDPNQLSPPEATVATLARSGHTNREIAHQLHLSVKTVETHLRHVYQKLGIRSRWQLTDHIDHNPDCIPGSDPRP